MGMSKIDELVLEVENNLSVRHTLLGSLYLIIEIKNADCQLE